MIVKEDFLKKLRSAFDLNIYEVKIWTALLSRGIATAGELSDISNVPRSRSYDILESLEKKGFVMMKLGKPIKYIAIKPEEILKRIRDDVLTNADSKVTYLESIKSDELFTELDLLYKLGIKKIEPHSLAGSIKGRDNIYTQLRNMLENAKKSVVILTSAPGLIRKAKRFKSLFAKLASKGMKIKIAVPDYESNNKDINEIKKYVQIKTIDKIKGRFIIVDEKEILFMIADDVDIHESYDTAVWVNTPYFAKAFSDMFNQTWDSLKNNGN